MIKSDDSLDEPEDSRFHTWKASTTAGEIARSVGERLIHQGFVRGHAEGYAKGRAAGRTEALRESLQRLLEARFGPASCQVSGHLGAAEPDELDAWFERALMAASLASVFETPPGEDG